MIKKALRIAEKAHKNQVDKGGRNYIEHPMTVAKMVKSKKAKVVALLHDVCEDIELPNFVKTSGGSGFCMKDCPSCLVARWRAKGKLRIGNSVGCRRCGIVSSNSLRRAGKLWPGAIATAGRRRTWPIIWE